MDRPEISAAAAARLELLARLTEQQQCQPFCGGLKTGVDLGTANIALVVTDGEGNPVTGISRPAVVVRDGIVVDYSAAALILTELKQELEQRLDTVLIEAATAIPPGISAGNTRVITNVVEAAGFQLTHVCDEPAAAALALGVSNGAVVDIGGGSTGISILQQGQLLFSDDEATGGTHMTMVLAGALGISEPEAEQLKKDPARQDMVFSCVYPVIQKMAGLTAGWLKGFESQTVYLTGGGSSVRGSAAVFSEICGCPVVSAPEPLLVTPLGIALYE